MRLSLHPDGVAPRVENFGEWRDHLVSRLRRQVETTADPVLAELLREVSGYPSPARDGAGSAANEEYAVAVPFRIRTEAGVLAFFSTTTVFGTPVDVTLSELALELFFPADARTVETVRRIEEIRAQNSTN